MSAWYGQSTCELEVATGTAVWCHAGMPVVPLRWVLVRDPSGKLEPKAFLCTDLEAGPLGAGGGAVDDRAPHPRSE